MPGSNTEVVTCGDDEKVCMWDLRSKKCVMETDNCHREKLYWAEPFSRDGKKFEVLTCGWDKGMKLWTVGGNVVKGKKIIMDREYPGHEGSVMHCSLNASKTMVASTDYKETVMLHQLDTGAVLGSAPIPKVTKLSEMVSDPETKSLGKHAKWEDRVANRKSKMVVEFPKMIWGCQFMSGCDDLFTSSMDGRLLRWNCAATGINLKNTY